MNLKKNHYSRRALALLLTLVMCVGMIPTAFAAQQNSYHDPRSNTGCRHPAVPMSWTPTVL